jgi:hypothetical protein
MNEIHVTMFYFVVTFLTVCCIYAVIEMFQKVCRSACYVVYSRNLVFKLLLHHTFASALKFVQCHYTDCCIL